MMTAAVLRGADAVDALRPANLTELEILQRRLEQLELSLKELQARPPIANRPFEPTLIKPLLLRNRSPVPVLPPREIPFVPQSHEGILRADQVRIYMHYQRVIPEVQTAGEVRTPTEPAAFQSGGITITR
jgi:hypothetical protein